MMKMMRTGQTLATSPHRFPIAIPHRFFFKKNLCYVKIQLKEKKKKEKTQIRIHSAIQTTAEFVL
jgi:hypothetical protein